MRRVRPTVIAGVVAALVLLPGGAALASAAPSPATTIALSEDGERYYFFDDSVLSGDGVAVTPGSTLRVPAPPEGAAWDTGGDFVLFEDEEIEFELEAVAEAAESLAGGEAAEGTGPVEFDVLTDGLDEIAAAEIDEPGAVVGGPIEADVDGGVRVPLAGDLPAGRYFAGLQATGPDVEVLYFVTLTVAAGDPVDITLDYTTSLFVGRTFITDATDATVPAGSRVTLTAPAGVDLREFEIEVYLPEDAEAEFPFFGSEELAVQDSDDGSSLSFAVPTELADGTLLEIYLFRVVGDDFDGPLDITEYVVTGVTVGAGATPSGSPTSTAVTTTPRIPTAVPAGGGPAAGSSAGPGSATVIAVAGVAALALGGLAVVAARRDRRVSGSHR